MSVLYWKGSFKQCRTKDLLVISYLLTYGCIAQVYLQLGPLLCQPCTSLWPKLLLHGYHSFLSGSQMSVDDLSTTLNWFKRLVHLDRPRVAQGHRGAPGQIARPPWLLLSGLVHGNNGSQAILNNVYFCFLSLHFTKSILYMQHNLTCSLEGHARNFPQINGFMKTIDDLHTLLLKFIMMRMEASLQVLESIPQSIAKL